MNSISYLHIYINVYSSHAKISSRKFSIQFTIKPNSNVALYFYYSSTEHLIQANDNEDEQ